MKGMGCVVYLYLTGFRQASGGANGRRVTGWGRVGAQPAYENGTDRVFRNVGYSNSDAGELPKRKKYYILLIS